MSQADRGRLYIDPGLQIPAILTLIVVVTAESLFVGVGFSRVIEAARHWEDPHQVVVFFWSLGLTLVPLVGMNFFLGLWLSHKVAAPLLKMRQALAEITRGNLEVEVAIRKGDLLHEHIQDLNRMVETLRRLLYRDHKHVEEINVIMTQCREAVARRKDLPDGARQEMDAFIDGAKSRLSIINAHFMKGRTEGTAHQEEAA